jgi:hypothetical protein
MAFRTWIGSLAVQLAAPAIAFAWCVGGAPPARDADDDGLNDIQEAFFATDPDDPDTDGDGTLDPAEDANLVGTVNELEPHIFSIEFFRDPFHPGRTGALFEGVNLFAAEVGTQTATISVLDTGMRRRVNYTKRRNRRTQIYVRLTSAQALRLFGSGDSPTIEVEARRGTTNTLSPTIMRCMPGVPKLMGAAIVEIRSSVIPEPLRYVVIGGCNLVDPAGGRAVRTRIRLADGDVELRGRYFSAAVVPSRLLVPTVSRAVSDPALPGWEEIEEGDEVKVVNAYGESMPATVEPPIAQITIPPSGIDEDHDQDGLTSLVEIGIGTDPLLLDTDRDGIDDGREVEGGVFDPLDPDSDGDLILDGDE